MVKVKNDNRPIGVFDSGIGGLTVAAAIKRILPHETIVYVGDLLHLPYGSKSSRAVLDFTRAAVQFLIDRKVKLIVIACNTATSIAKKKIEKEVDIPVVGVIEPGAQSACRVTENKQLGVIGTTRTIRSNAYPEAIKMVDPGISVFQIETPLLVPLIEEGWLSHPVLGMVLDEYFRFFHEKSIDTIVLGCTHYPLIKSQIQRALHDVNIVDSAETTAEATETILRDNEMLCVSSEKGGYHIFLTDYAENFKLIGEKILKMEFHDINIITLNYSEGKLGYDCQPTEKGSLL